MMRKINKLLSYPLILGVITSGFFVKPTFSQSNSSYIIPSKECIQKISFVLEQIRSHGVETPRLMSYKNNANERHTGNPTNRNGHIIIALSVSSSTYDVMNSIELMKNWSNQIVSSCPNAASISFFGEARGAPLSFAIQEDKTLKRRKCVHPETGFPLNWDTETCT